MAPGAMNCCGSCFFSFLVFSGGICGGGRGGGSGGGGGGAASAACEVVVDDGSNPTAQTCLLQVIEDRRGGGCNLGAEPGTSDLTASLLMPSCTGQEAGPSTDRGPAPARNPQNRPSGFRNKDLWTLSPQKLLGVAPGQGRAVGVLRSLRRVEADASRENPRSSTA